MSINSQDDAQSNSAVAWAFGGNDTPSRYFNLWLKSLTNPDGSAK